MYATDASLHRCGECGTWCVGSRPCTTCQIQHARPEELRGGTWVSRGPIKVWQPRRDTAA